MESNYTAANIFKDTKVESFPRHLFSLDFTNSFSCGHGYAIPNMVIDVSPGDRLDCRSYGRVQLTPLSTSSMQNIRCYQRYFYVPFRLLWDRFDKFISQDGFVDTPILAPYTTLTGAQLNSLVRTAIRDNQFRLHDFLGLQVANFDTDNNPVLYSSEARVSFDLFRWLAYWLIWDTYFRDENHQSETFFDPSIGGYVNPNGISLNIQKLSQILPVAKEKDYFTTALPWLQKGMPVTLGSEINIPSLPVYLKNSNMDLNFKPVFKVGEYYEVDQYPAGTRFEMTFENAEGVSTATVLPNQQIGGDLVTPSYDQLATTISINELRYANAMQRYLERLALGGNRPAEFYLSMYGVKVDDLRIGQPKYLGGGSTYVHVSSIAQTSTSTGSESPLGSLAGNGVAQLEFSFNEPEYCQEFGIVMGIFYIRPELNYTQGIPKTMRRFSHLDFYNPIFAHLGEEPVLTSELYVKPNIIIDPSNPELDNDTTFGYQSRYAYLKSRRNEIHGDLLYSLRDWMIGTHFHQEPILNASFITQPQNYDIFAVTDAAVVDHYICEVGHEIECESSMPDFAIPSL